MITNLIRIGFVLAIALPILDFVMFRPRRKALGDARLAKFEKLAYLLFLVCVALMTLSSLCMLAIGQVMHRWMLVLHMAVAGGFAVTLTAVALMWAEQSSRSEGEQRFYPGEKVAFWLTVVAGLATIVTAMLGMMTWFGSAGQITLLKLHKLSALGLMICAVYHGYRVLAGRPRATA